MTDSCRLSRWTELYLDGELSPEHTVDFEDHLSECSGCQCKLKFEQALRFSVRRTVRVDTYPSQEFEAKIRALVAASCAKETTVTKSSPATRRASTVAALPVRPLTWRSITPLSVAAAAALVFAGMRNTPTDETSPRQADIAGTGSSARSTERDTIRSFLDQLAAETDSLRQEDGSAQFVEEAEPVFLSPMPPAVIAVSDKRRMATPRLSDVGAIWEGLHYRNLAAIQGRIPSLRYRIGGHRVLLWAYDSERVPLRVVLEPHVARNRPCFVGTHNGLAFAAVEHGGHGIVATTDLTTREAAEVAVTAALH